MWVSHLSLCLSLTPPSLPPLSASYAISKHSFWSTSPSKAGCHLMEAFIHGTQEQSSLRHMLHCFSDPSHAKATAESHGANPFRGRQPWHQWLSSTCRDSRRSLSHQISSIIANPYSISSIKEERGKSPWLHLAVLWAIGCIISFAIPVVMLDDLLALNHCISIYFQNIKYGTTWPPKCD